jgi:hypothetical protein
MGIVVGALATGGAVAGIAGAAAAPNSTTSSTTTAREAACLTIYQAAWVFGSGSGATASGVSEPWIGLTLSAPIPSAA